MNDTNTTAVRVITIIGSFGIAADGTITAPDLHNTVVTPDTMMDCGEAGKHTVRTLIVNALQDTAHLTHGLTPVATGPLSEPSTGLWGETIAAGPTLTDADLQRHYVAVSQAKARVMDVMLIV